LPFRVAATEDQVKAVAKYFFMCAAVDDHIPEFTDSSIPCNATFVGTLKPVCKLALDRIAASVPSQAQAATANKDRGRRKKKSRKPVSKKVIERSVTEFYNHHFSTMRSGLGMGNDSLSATRGPETKPVDSDENVSQVLQKAGKMHAVARKGG
jgi:hypothetical protein